ncbi:MAG: prephenate dehydrogenase [Clostridiales bacterium]|nr:prephenate dehydrogenase [Clostridiales bacterium]
MDKTIGVIGLGLIGGSLAKAIKANTTHTVYGMDKRQEVMEIALRQNAMDAALTPALYDKCDMLLLALYPTDIISFVKDNIGSFKKGVVIVDCAGVKGNICEALSEWVAGHGMYFIGGHPMQGIEKTGFESSYSHLFDGATMILCKDRFTNLIALKAAEVLFTSLGFMKVTITEAGEHDKIIAFTSQLAHVVSNAYIKSDIAPKHMGFTAGSYKDLTRVAWLNEELWTELFFENKENLTAEIEGLADRLRDYANALREGDKEGMKRMLREGKLAKEAIG